jgi:ribonuclease P protein component
MLAKANRLKGKANFEMVFKKGEKFYSPYFVIYFQRSALLPATAALIGIVTSKKVGGAVERNHARRLLGEAIKPLLPKLPPNSRTVIIALKTAATAELSALQTELTKVRF